METEKQQQVNPHMNKQRLNGNSNIYKYKECDYLPPHIEPPEGKNRGPQWGMTTGAFYMLAVPHYNCNSLQTHT